MGFSRSTRPISCRNPLSRCAVPPRIDFCGLRPRRPQSKRSLADAASVSGVEAITIDGTRFDEMRRAHSGINPTQRVGGRLFIIRDGTWTDLGHGDSLRVVTIAPYSDA